MYYNSYTTMNVSTEPCWCDVRQEDRREHGDPQILLSLEHSLRGLIVCRPRCDVLSRELIVIFDILHGVLVVERGTDAKETTHWQVVRPR